MSERNGARKRAAAQRRKKRRLALVILLTLLILLLAGVLVFAAYRVFLSPGSASSEASSDTGTTGTQTTTTAGTTASTGTTTRKVTAEEAANYVQQDRSVWNLILVNDHNPLPENFESTVNIIDFNGPGKQCDERIAEPLRAMLEAGKEYGLAPVSMFRERALQEKLYNREVSEWQAKGYSLAEAQVQAATVVKRPGESEHNTGLTIDIGGSGNFTITESFADTPAYAWLIEHCAEYGFILRYPEGKENITAVIYEPWHYRYVGVEAATEIMERGITLEEYIAERGM